MRERPPLPDHALASALASGWGVAAASIEFLPVGDDSRAWSFAAVAATAPGGSSRSGGERSTRRPCSSPCPCATTAWSRWWRPLDGCTLLVYPWAGGVPAIGRGLTDRQWAALGRFVAAARPELVLCHADIHLANLLVAGEDRLAVVDTARRVDPDLAVS